MNVIAARTGALRSTSSHSASLAPPASRPSSARGNSSCAAGFRPRSDGAGIRDDVQVDDIALCAGRFRRAPACVQSGTDAFRVDVQTRSAK